MVQQELTSEKSMPSWRKELTMALAVPEVSTFER